MKKAYLILLAVAAFFTASCSQKLESGVEYPALKLNDTTLVFKVGQVIQNEKDVKPYFSFFNDITLTLSYKNGTPDKLTFEEPGAPFSVTNQKYSGVFESEWYLDSSSSPYKVMLKGSDEVFCFIDRSKVVTFPFQLGAPSNKYEYRLVTVKK